VFPGSDELRLLAALALNGLVGYSAWRLARGRGNDPVQATADALLLSLCIQYTSVVAAGLMGLLTWPIIALLAVLQSLALLYWTRRGPGTLACQPPTNLTGHRPLVLLAWALAGYVVAAVGHMVQGPAIATDALTYHLPAAAQWIQHGRLGLYEIWFHNPANTYSPLAGSVFIAWWVAPLGNDALARFVQLPALALLVVSMVNWCRQLGASLALASVLAVGAVLARPLVSQAILAKDDLYVAAFFMAALVGLTRWKQNPSAWRVGLAVGLLISVKYTALLALPALLLMLPWRTELAPPKSWRPIAVALVVALVLAAPWYLRNGLLWGSPLFPVEVRVGGRRLLDGLFPTHADPALHSAASLWGVLSGGYFGTPPLLLGLWVVGWVVALAMNWRRLGTDPLLRTCVLGPPLLLAVYVLASPYAELRFLYPALLMSASCWAMVVGSISGRWRAAMLLRYGPALLLLGVAALTAFDRQHLPALLLSAAAGVAVGIALLLLSSRTRPLGPKLAAVAVVGIAGWSYVYWPAYLRDLEDEAPELWRQFYGPVADVWAAVRTPEKVRRGATIAYTNTHLTYPLMGFRLDHRLVAVPCGRGLVHVHDLPHFGRSLSGPQVQEALLEQIRKDADQSDWLKRLAASGAEYLVISRQFGDTIEQAWVKADPRRFTLLLENQDAALYHIAHRQP